MGKEKSKFDTIHGDGGSGGGPGAVSTEQLLVKYFHTSKEDAELSILTEVKDLLRRIRFSLGFGTIVPVLVIIGNTLAVNLWKWQTISDPVLVAYVASQGLVSILQAFRKT